MGSRSANDSPHLSATVAGTFTMAEDLTVTRMGYARCSWLARTSSAHPLTMLR